MTEIDKRKKAALATIKGVVGTGTKEDEYGAGLFISHHIEEIDESYWQEHLGTRRPEPEQVLDMIEFQSHWGGDDGIEVFDFTLPGDVTQYVIAVRFDESGEIAGISMES